MRRPPSSIVRRPSPGAATNSLDFQHDVLLAEHRLQYELRNIVDGRPPGRPSFVRAVVRVAVDDSLHMVEAIDRITQALRSEILINRRWLAFDRSLDR